MSRFHNLRFGLLLHSLSLFFAPASSELVNITVDDQLGDPTTGLVPQYFPDDVWNAGSPTENCTRCHLNPQTLDLNQIHNKTWHDATPLNSPTPTTITVHFTGSAVYVFNVVPNTLPNSTITIADIAFSIDGSNPYTFTRQPDPNSDTILYNQLVYRNTTLEDGPHTLTMTVGSYSLVLFDYLLYTQSNDTTSATATSTSTNAGQPPPTQPNTPTSARSSSTPIGAIAGGVVGGIVLLSGVALGAFVLGRRRTHSKHAQPPQSHSAFPTRPVDPDATSSFIAPWLYGAETHNLLDRTSNVSGQVTPRPSPVVADGALTAGWSSKRRSELTHRLETLQRTRSVLSSSQPGPPSGRARSESGSQGGTETAMRELEAEIAELRGELAALNVRLADHGHDEHSEPLPEYVE
ncbi:hypothetical protein V8D89_007071 [Ganoderma adspersum]